MRHGIISWFLLILFLASPSFPNQQQAPKKSRKEIDEEQRVLAHKDMEMQRLAEEAMEGRQAFVRIYYDWQKDFRAFKLIPIKLVRLLIKPSQIAEVYGKVPESAVFAFVGSDQKDELVAEAANDYIFLAMPKSYSLAIWAPLDFDRKYEPLIFNDALGNPIPNANVELLIGGSHVTSHRICIDLGKLDGKGRLKRPRLGRFARMRAFVISHPDYGIALANTTPNRGLRELADTYTVPIVPIGTVADERTIHGIVVDVNDNPVKDVTLECGAIYTSSGGRLSAGAYTRYETITDANGQFAMYLPIDRDTDKQKSLIPLRAEYHVKAKPPIGLGLKYAYDQIKSGEESRIVLQPKKKEASARTFAFEDESGPITDPTRLKNVKLTYRTDKSHGTLVPYDKWGYRTNPPIGTYTARMGEGPEQRFFGPIEVTEDSPDVLVFKPHALTRCWGRVLHGITGKPLKGALVAADYMLALPKESSLAPLKEQRAIQESQGAVHTDDNGRFEMTLPVLRRRMSIYAFEKDFLRTDRRISDYEGAVGPLEDITMKLFPAATIIIEPNAPAKVNDKNLTLRYWGKGEIDPAWLDSGVTGERDGRIFSTASEDMRLNSVRSIRIPADLTLDFTLRFLDNDKWCPIVIRNIRLEQGQTLDLGRQDFKPALRVRVRLVDSAGEPVHGVTLVHRTNNIASSSSKPVSNEQGITYVYLPPNSSGKFLVQYIAGLPDKFYEESAPFEVGGEEDRDRMYTFQLSDQMISDLFK